MRVTKQLFLLGAVLPLMLGAQTPPTGYDQLQDIYIIKSNPPGSYAGGDATAALDPNTVYNGNPSMHFQVTGPTNGWWISIWWGSDNHPWVDYSIEYYRPAYLEFDVLGAKGSEQFTIQFNDEDPSRSQVDYNSATVNIANYVTVSTSWQHVKIPLTDFQLPAGFKTRQMHSLQFGDGGGSWTKEWWINGLKWTSPSKEHSFPAIKVNQVGYQPIGTKYALVTGFGELLSAAPGTPFHVINSNTHTSVYDGRLTLASEYDSLSGDEVLTADFSPVTTPGTYFIRVEAPGIDDSLQFKIGFGIFGKVLRDSMRYYYFQRQGIAITEPYGEGFTRPLGTPSEVAAYYESSGPNGPTRDISHGWYDAGDTGKYVANSPAVIVDLLSAYATFPWVFYDGQNNIPESGNGKPDILDEVKWELDWLVKMQDQDSGGFYAIAYAGNCPSNVTPCNIDSETGSYVVDVVGGVSGVKPTPETANAVAALAYAARVYRRYDGNLAASYLAAAEKGWAYLAANPTTISSNGLTYGSSDDSDGRFWAAAELYRTTGQDVYGNYFLSTYRNYDSKWNQPNGTEFDLPFRAFIAYNMSGRVDPAEYRSFQQNYALWRAGQLSRIASNPWRNSLYSYWWGSNSVALGVVPFLVLCDRVAGYRSSNDVLDAAKDNLNYILGINPLRRSYVVGEGADSATTTFSGLYWDYHTYTPPAGYMGGGPNWYNSPWFSQFQARAYADSNVDYQINENDIGYNLPLVFTAAVVQAGTLTPVTATSSGLTYSRGNGTYNGTITLTNSGLIPIKGPFQLLFTNLTSGVTPVNADGQIGGSFYIITAPAELAPGQSVSVRVRFSNPSNEPITFTPLVTQGAH